LSAQKVAQGRFMFLLREKVASHCPLWLPTERKGSLAGIHRGGDVRQPLPISGGDREGRLQKVYLVPLTSLDQG
jgi:hypothetical protein